MASPDLNPVPDLSDQIRDSDAEGIARTINQLTPAETACAVMCLDIDLRQQLFALLPPEQAAEVILDLPDEDAADVIDDLGPAEAAQILERLPDDERADALGDLSRARAEAILGRMAPREAAQARRLMVYPDHTAGGLMTSECLAYDQSASVAELIDDLRAHREDYARFDVQYVYVVEDGRQLVGILRLRDLLLAPPETTLSTLMIRNPVSVRAEEPIERVRALFQERGFMGLPVVDEANLMLGVVTREDASEAAGRIDRDLFLKISGILGGEEYRNMPFRRRTARRLSWLSLNVVLNLVSASVIALHQDTLSAAVVLAVFLPIISDMSGCSGNQAVAVSIRELSLGLLRPSGFLRVLANELAVGLVNGMLLGLLLGTVAFAWKGNLYLSTVVGASLALNTILSVCVGGLLPLALRCLRFDPALASGPILTTLTDMCGFFFVLNFAGFCLSKLP